MNVFPAEAVAKNPEIVLQRFCDLCRAVRTETDFYEQSPLFFRGDYCL